MAHTLPQLPYAFDALEPHIDAKTMEIHSQKHHKAYVDNLNKALESAPELANVRPRIDCVLRVATTPIRSPSPAGALSWPKAAAISPTC